MTCRQAYTLRRASDRVEAFHEHGIDLNALALSVVANRAYGFVMASNYNSRPRPAEVVVDGDRWWVARPREVVEDLFATERLSP